MSCLCQLCRSALAERLLRDMCVESCARCVGARRCSSTSSYTIYKVRRAGKVCRPSRTSSLHRRRSRPPRSDSAQAIISSVARSCAEPDRAARANTSILSSRVKTRYQSVSGRPRTAARASETLWAGRPWSRRHFLAQCTPHATTTNTRRIPSITRPHPPRRQVRLEVSRRAQVRVQ